jgi:S-adenosylmethionine synthetase
MEDKWISVSKRPPYAPVVEAVERKGAGHPDTLCDHVAESLARRLGSLYLERTGEVRHFNVDKGLLIAGEVDVGFGGGRLLRPFQLIVAGRADLLDGTLDVERLEDGLRADLAAALPDAGPAAFDVELRLSPPSAALARLATPAEGVPRANDTSVAVVSLPRSPLEEAVFAVERHLTSSAVRERLPLGPDVKVMGTRRGGDTVFTAAVAVLAPHAPDARAYDEVLAQVAKEVRGVAEPLLRGEIALTVNAAGSRSPNLTLCGSSAEAADDGQVGRGNRFGGLITPCRPMSLEACTGKNPVTHVGKTYHAVAHDIATDVITLAGARQASVLLVSRIGNDIRQPQIAEVAVDGDPDPAAVREIVARRLADWQAVRDRLLTGAYVLF